jgi:hypothetical protein
VEYVVALGEHPDLVVELVGVEADGAVGVIDQHLVNCLRLEVIEEVQIVINLIHLISWGLDFMRGGEFAILVVAMDEVHVILGNFENLHVIELSLREGFRDLQGPPLKQYFELQSERRRLLPTELHGQRRDILKGSLNMVAYQNGVQGSRWGCRIF